MADEPARVAAPNTTSDTAHSATHDQALCASPTAPDRALDPAGRARERLGDALLETAAYVLAAAGYLTSILLAGRVGLAGFAALTLGTAGWAACFWWLTTSPGVPASPFDRRALGLLASTLLVLAAPWGGVSLDWLLPMVTVSVVTVCFSWRTAGALTVGLWIATALDVAALDGSGTHVTFAYMAQDQISIAAGFAFVYAISLVYNLQAEQRSRAEALLAQLEAAHAELRASARAAEELAVTRERNRMAREIHDTLGHYLTILMVKLETAIKLEERTERRMEGATVARPDASSAGAAEAASDDRAGVQEHAGAQPRTGAELRGELVEARRVAAECLAEVRRSVAALRPADPGAASLAGSLPASLATDLAAGLRRLVAEFEGAAPGVETAVDVEGPARTLGPEVRAALYRCAQEALTNVRKHAHASKVLLRLRVDAARAELTVLDNGAGADGADSHEPGFGLIGMRERIALCGGTLRAGPEPGRGWRVEAVVPVVAPGVPAGLPEDARTGEPRALADAPTVEDVRTPLEPSAAKTRSLEMDRRTADRHTADRHAADSHTADSHRSTDPLPAASAAVEG